MFNNEQFKQISQLATNSIENSIKVMNVALENSQKLVQHQLNASKTAFENSAKSARELTTLKTPQEVGEHLKVISVETLELLVSNAREFCNIVSTTQNEVHKLTQEHIDDAHQKLNEQVEAFAEKAPTTAEPVIHVMKSSIAASSIAANNLAKTSKQMVDFAEANLVSAAQATEAAIKKTDPSNKTK
ncbi:MAG: phasin family protein [Neisseriaceae bacterium]|nr:phasin family protein [Neisseriaceae bacterium]